MSMPRTDPGAGSGRSGPGRPGGPWRPGGAGRPGGPGTAPGQWWRDGGWDGENPWAQGAPWSRGHRHGPGVRLALFLAFVQVVGTSFAAWHGQVGVRPLGWGGYGLLLASALVLVPRRRFRVPAMIATVALTLAYYLLAYPAGPFFLAALAALAGGIFAGRRIATWIVAGCGYAALVAVALVPGELVVRGYPVSQPGVSALVVVAGWLLLTLAIPAAIRNRASAMAEIGRTRAEQARARAEQQRRQTSEERLRIAQELHDVVGHHLSLINVQAGVGLHLMDSRPEQARVALQTIKTASSAALAEVRAVLGVLRAEDDEQAPRAPAPSLANLGVLLEGSGADLVTSGAERALPPEVDRAAYRIVREALTNVRRHAGEGARATVTIGYARQALEVTVLDDGAGSPAEPAEGNGLAGMRARAEALGGTLHAGPVPGGFQVYARLPLPPTDPGGDPGADPAIVADPDGDPGTGSGAAAGEDGGVGEPVRDGEAE